MNSSSNRKINYDVIVVGGGVSGAIAALAAARLGASTLVVEEQGFLGGTLTAMGVGPMMSFHNSAGEQMVRGLADELIDRLVRRGASPGHIPDTTTYCSTVTPFDSEELKIELETMLEEAGAHILFHTQLAAADCAEGRVQTVTLCNKAGLATIAGRVFLDASGDGDLAHRTGAAFEHGRSSDSATQPMTMNLKLANVDTAAIRQYVLDHPENFSWEHGREQGLQRLRESPRLSLAGYLREWRAARASGELDVPRDLVLMFETATPGVVIINSSRILGLDPTNPYELSQAEMIGRRQCRQIFHFLRNHCAGFQNAVRMDTSAKIGVRESRHIRGLHLLTAEDLLEGRDFPDRIAWGGYPIDIHSPDGEKTITRHTGRVRSYQIPLRSLIVKEPRNLVVVGRCISATHEAAAAIRVTPIAMAIGHAGGVLAAKSLDFKDDASLVPPAIVQAALREQGAIVD